MDSSQTCVDMVKIYQKLADYTTETILQVCKAVESVSSKSDQPIQAHELNLFGTSVLSKMAAKISEWWAIQDLFFFDGTTKPLL